MRKSITIAAVSLLAVGFGGMVVANNHKAPAPVPQTSNLPPAVVAPAYIPTPTPTPTPAGKYAALEARFGITIHDGLDQFSSSYAYTKCDPGSGVGEVYVSPAILEKWEFAVIAHEYGHTLECKQGWGANVASPLGEEVADAVSILLGGAATYPNKPSANAFHLAEGLLATRTG